MGRRDELIEKYADDLRTKCGMDPDMDLLRKVTIACGPAIYNADASTVAGSQPDELETVKKNFLMKKLGLPDGAELDVGSFDIHLPGALRGFGTGIKAWVFRRF